MHFELGGLGGEAVEEGVLIAAADDEEALEPFAGEQGNAVEHLGVTRGQRVEDEAGEFGRVGRALVEGFEAAVLRGARSLFSSRRVDAVLLEASPSISDIRDRPGPDVAVIAFAPANDAPITTPIADSSSSVCTHVPPIFGSHSPRKCSTSDDGVIG